MDVAAPFKSEVLRPLITLVFPGTIALGPFVLLLGHYVSPVPQFWLQHPHAFALLLGMSVLAAGFIIDNVGSTVERYWWDRRIDTATEKKHMENWCAYLKLQMQDEIVAQRYIRQKVTQLKFELAMPPALAIFWLGLLWLQLTQGIWSTVGFILATVPIWAGCAYLLWESGKTANVLSETRALLLEAIDEGLKGIKRQAPGA